MIVTQIQTDLVAGSPIDYVRFSKNLPGHGNSVREKQGKGGYHDRETATKPRWGYMHVAAKV